MNLFVVDSKKCKKDKLCVAVCPMGIIELKQGSSVPTPADGADKLCRRCGHCVAICPQGALSHRDMTPEQCSSIRKDKQPGPEQVEQFLRSRRSIRVYQDKAIDRDTLTKLVNIACFAPSSHNTQPVEWLIIHDSGEVRRLAGSVIEWMRMMLKDNPQLAISFNMDHVVKRWDAGIDSICRGAPHVLVAHALKDNPFAQSASTIALAYLELGIHAVGLGACWAGYFDAAVRFWPPLQKDLGLPEGHGSFGAMMVGYPKFSYCRIPRRNEARIIWR